MNTYDYQSLWQEARGMRPWQIVAICAVCGEKTIPIVRFLGLPETSSLARKCVDFAWSSVTTANPDIEEGERLMDSARQITEAGCFSMVLEMIPQGLAGQITREIPIPTIGIGAGPECDGQVLVLPDMLGLNEAFSPGFLKRYAKLAGSVREAVAEYVREVKEGSYPGPEHSYE